MSQDFNENLGSNEQESEKKSEYAYKNVMDGKQKKRTWSVISFILSLISIAFCSVPIAGIILGLLSLGAAIYSRKYIGYFDGFSLAGLMIGIFGVVFSVGAIILQKLIVHFIASLF